MWHRKVQIELIAMVLDILFQSELTEFHIDEKIIRCRQPAVLQERHNIFMSSILKQCRYRAFFRFDNRFQVVIVMNELSGEDQFRLVLEV
jgi:hypothetical protein